MSQLSTEELEQLSNLLLSTDDQNTHLAFEMMEGKTWSATLLTELFVVCKLSGNDAFKERAKAELERLDPNMSNVLALKQKLSREGKNSSGANEKTIAKNIQYYVTVSKQQLDGIKLAKALVQKYGHGYQYLLDTLKGDDLIQYLGTFLQGKHFDFSKKGVTKLPKEIFKVSGIQEVEEFDVSGNKIATLPNQIGQLTQLRKLNLSSNNLKKVHKNIQKCTQLEWLDLSRNNFKHFPEEICGCTSLKELHLLYSASYFSDEFILPESFIDLKNLHTLIFYRDNKDHAPNLYTVLANCQQLEHLSLSEYTENPNQIAQLQKQLPNCTISTSKALAQLNYN